MESEQFLVTAVVVVVDRLVEVTMVDHLHQESQSSQVLIHTHCREEQAHAVLALAFSQALSIPSMIIFGPPSPVLQFSWRLESHMLCELDLQTPHSVPWQPASQEYNWLSE